MSIINSLEQDDEKIISLVDSFKQENKESIDEWIVMIEDTLNPESVSVANVILIEIIKEGNIGLLTKATNILLNNPLIKPCNLRIDDFIYNIIPDENSSQFLVATIGHFMCREWKREGIIIFNIDLSQYRMKKILKHLNAEIKNNKSVNLMDDMFEIIYHVQHYTHDHGHKYHDKCVSFILEQMIEYNYKNEVFIKKMREAVQKTIEQSEMVVLMNKFV